MQIRNPSASIGGEVTLGGTNLTYYQPPFHYVPLSSTKYWQFKIDG